MNPILKYYKLKFPTILLLTIVVFGLQQAQAHLLPPQQFQTNAPLNSGTSEATYLNQNGYTDDCCQFLAKWDNGEGFTSGDFSEFFTVSETSGNTWTITWDLH